MTTTQKVLTATFITAIILFFFKKRSKAQKDQGSGGNSQNQPQGTPPEGHIERLFINPNYDFENEVFNFSTPLGGFTIEQPDTTSTAYNNLASAEGFEFGWQAPTPGVVVVTLLPLEQNAVVESIILNLNNRSVKFEYVQL